VRTCRRELLDRTLIWNQWHLLYALPKFEQFYSPSASPGNRVAVATARAALANPRARRRHPPSRHGRVPFSRRVDG
jgi:hypothetical protein